MKILILFLLLISFLFSSNTKKVTMQLSWKHQFQFAGFYIAKEKGFYEEVGLDVDIKDWSHGIDVVNDVVSNKIQFAIARPSSIIDISKGNEILYLAAIYQSSPLVFLAKKSSNIKSVRDFKNKTVMIIGDHIKDASIKSILSSNNIDINSMKILKHSFDVKDLANGKTDLMVSYISNEPYTLKELGYEPVVFSAQDFGFNYYNDLLITSISYKEKNPEIVKKFKAATLKGFNYAFDHIDETVKLVYEKYNGLNKSIDGLKYEANTLKNLIYDENGNIGTITEEKLSKIYNVYKILGLSKLNINLDDFIYKEFIPHKYFTKEEVDYLKNKKSISYCVDPSWAPFEFIDENNQHNGISKDYKDLLEKKLDTKFNLVKTKTWDEALLFAKEKKCEVLFLAMKTPQRSKYLNFTQPYLTMPLVLATTLNTPFIEDVKSLKNKKIGIVKGYAYYEIFKKKYPEFDLIEVENIQDGLEKVSKGKLDVYIGTLASVGGEIQKEYFGKLKISGKLDEELSLGLAVENDNLILIDIFIKAINDISSQTHKDILNKWLSVKYEQATDYSLVLKVVIVSILIMLIFIYWNRKLMLAKNIIEKQNKELEILATTDKLTGIYNRKKIDEIIKNEIDRSIRYNHSFGCAIIDIDFFKKINDTYGHLVGDEVLVRISSLINENIRKSDYFGRWGGEEFLIIFPEINKDNMLTVLEKIRGIIEETPINNIGYKTVSIGATEFDKNDNINTIIKRADDALYEAKESGRNKVCFK